MMASHPNQEDSSIGNSSSQHNGENSKFRSLIWNHYTTVTEVKDGKELNFGICKYCQKQLSSANTSNLLIHSRKHHRDQLEPQLLIVKNKTVVSSNFEFSPNAYRKSLVKWIVTSNQPFTVAQEPDFISFVKTLNPAADGFSNDTIRRDILEEHRVQLQNLKLKLEETPGSFSFTQDSWTSKSCLPFVATKIHFVDKDWNLQQHLIDFSLLEGSHTGKLLKKHFLESLVKLKIPIEKVLGLTMDNASNNDTFITELSKVTPITPSRNQIRCLAHVVNLAVQDFLSKLKIQPIDEDSEDGLELVEELINENVFPNQDDEDDDDPMDGSFEFDVRNNISPIIFKIRKLVRKVRKSPQIRQKLQLACEQLNVKPLMPIIDVKTRWNSTHHMLKRAQFLKAPLLNLCSSTKALNKFVITENEWSLLSEVDGLLENFEEASNLASLAKESTISRYLLTFDFLLESVKDFQEKHAKSSKVLAAAAKEAQKKLEKHYPTFDKCETAYISLILHPALRTKYFEDKHTDAIQKKITDRFLKIYDDYLKKYPEYKKQQSNSNQSPPSTTKGLAGFMYKKAKFGNEGFEPEEYLNATTFPSTNVDVLLWWKANENEFPILAKMARDFLPIQSGSVAVEREFSGGTDLVTPTRCSLNAESVTACMMLKSYYRSI